GRSSVSSARGRVGGRCVVVRVLHAGQRGPLSFGAGRGGGAQGADVAGAHGTRCCGGAQSLDLVVLGGQAGQCQGALVLQRGDGLVLAGAAVGMAAGCGRGGHVMFELLLQVRIAAVEGRAGHAGLAGQRGDVATAAGGDVASQQRGCGDAGALLGLLPFVVGDGHGCYSLSAGLPAGSVSGWAASMASTTRWARSTSPCRRACSV